MPVDGITRPDRTRSLPVAPDRETARLIDREARPGLPDITPTPVAVVPRLRNADGRLPARRTLVPPDDVIKRPVLTRNRVVDGSGENKIPRERRLIVPRPGDFVTGTPRDKERTGENRRARLPELNPGETGGPDKKNDSPRIAIPRPVDSDSNEGEEKVTRRRRGNETIRLNPPAGSEGNETGEPARERRRKEPVVITQPAPKDDDSAQRGGGSDRKRSRGDNNDRAKETEKLRQPAEDSTRWRNRDETPARRPEPRMEQPRHQQENKTESRQERRQEKQESRQERREERKKP
jgi:hypothetical protein